MFADRAEAGQRLAAALIEYADASAPPIVLGIPRGGVIVARQVADALHAPLDVILTHKLGAPGNPELAIGAVAEDGTLLLDELLLHQLWLPRGYLDQEIERQRAEMQRRAEVYRRGRARVDVSDRTVIVIDDGVATGSTLIAALRSVRRQGAAKIVAAVPVGPRETARRLRLEADDVVMLEAPFDFMAVGQFYHHFEQVTDDEVRAALAQ